MERTAVFTALTYAMSQIAPLPMEHAFATQKFSQCEIDRSWKPRSTSVGLFLTKHRSEPLQTNEPAIGDSRLTEGDA